MDNKKVKTAKVISIVPLNVRTKSNGLIIGELQPGDIVEIKGRITPKTEWYKIKYNNLSGYCMAKYLSVEE